MSNLGRGGFGRSHFRSGSMGRHLSRIHDAAVEATRHATEVALGETHMFLSSFDETHSTPLRHSNYAELIVNGVENSAEAEVIRWVAGERARETLQTALNEGLRRALK